MEYIIKDIGTTEFFVRKRLQEFHQVIKLRVKRPVHKKRFCAFLANGYTFSYKTYYINTMPFISQMKQFSVDNVHKKQTRVRILMPSVWTRACVAVQMA